MTNIQKHHLDSFYLVGELKEHKDIKNLILEEIDKNKYDSLSLNCDELGSQHITKLDWNSASTIDREWFKIIIHPLYNYLTDCAKSVGFNKVEVYDLWFQQYYINDYHAWHVHSNNFVGVYYLELDANAPLTELICPYSLNKIVTPKVKEGDILLFPSYVIHRAPRINSSIRKTIISFNMDFQEINSDLLYKYKI